MSGNNNDGSWPPPPKRPRTANLFYGVNININNVFCGPPPPPAAGPLPAAAGLVPAAPFVPPLAAPAAAAAAPAASAPSHPVAAPIAPSAPVVASSVAPAAAVAAPCAPVSAPSVTSAPSASAAPLAASSVARAAPVVPTLAAPAASIAAPSAPVAPSPVAPAKPVGPLDPAVAPAPLVARPEPAAAPSLPLRDLSCLSSAASRQPSSPRPSPLSLRLQLPPSPPLRFAASSVARAAPLVPLLVAPAASVSPPSAPSAPVAASSVVAPAPVVACPEEAVAAAAQDVEHENICPITLAVPVHPVRAPDGHVYERDSIVQWLQRTPRSPLTNQCMTIEDLVPLATGAGPESLVRVAYVRSWMTGGSVVSEIVALAAAGLVGADAAAGLVLQFNGSLALLAGADPVWASGHMTAHIDPFRCPSEANGTARLYLNGEPAGRWAGIGASSTGRAPLVVGRTASDESGDSWAGLVDDVAVWARALSPAEVARLRGIGDSDMDAGLAEGLVLYARADSDTLDRSLDSGPGGHGGVPSRGELLYGGYRARVAYRPDCIAPRGQRACTPLSMASVCGDGAVTGAEECDGGPGCTATCSCAEGTARGEWGCAAKDQWCRVRFARAGDEMVQQFMSVDRFRLSLILDTAAEYHARWHCSLTDIGGSWITNWLSTCLMRVRKFGNAGEVYPDPYCYELMVGQRYQNRTDKQRCYSAGFFWCLDRCVPDPIDCKPMCGKSVLDEVIHEKCDLGTLGSLTTGGCAPGCTAVNVGYTCHDSGSLCNATCGDGIKANSEDCDDGNTVAGDGCDPVCRLESGYECSLASSIDPTGLVAATAFVALVRRRRRAQHRQHLTSHTRPWSFESALYPTPGSFKGYALIPAGKEDMERVLAAYNEHPVPGMSVASVEIIHSPTLEVLFASCVEQLQRRRGDVAYAPAWLHEDNVVQRASVIEYLGGLCEPHRDPEFPDVGLLPLWHGTSPDVLDSLCKTGFANLALTDQGYFGKGLYATTEAIYAHDAYAADSGGVLLLCWVSFFSAYPVVAGDMAKLTGKAHWANHDTHFVPVVPEGPGDVRKQKVFFPCADVAQAVYHEMVVFEAAQMLPRYVVRFETLPREPERLVVDGSELEEVPDDTEGQREGTDDTEAGATGRPLSRTTSDESGGDSWAGLVDNVDVWARALSPAEVARLCSLGSSGMDAGLAEGLVLYARADSDTLDRSLDSGPGGHGGVPPRDKLLYGDRVHSSRDGAEGEQWGPACKAACA
eukprot:m51a1_g12188 hypothetical protein (1248) ;mRNA; f:11695-17986